MGEDEDGKIVNIYESGKHSKWMKSATKTIAIESGYPSSDCDVIEQLQSVNKGEFLQKTKRENCKIQCLWS